MDFPQRLIDGYGAFLSERLPREQSRFRELAETGQHPEIMVIGCCDSRVSPEVIFDARPGELFVVRNVANLVPPYQPDGHYHGTSSAIEFAVRDLAVAHIVVLGHSGCGGVQALLQPAEKSEEREFIAGWMAIAGRARAALPAAAPHHAHERSRAVEQAAIRVSLENLRTFPWIRSPLMEGKLSLHGWWFDLEAGELWGIDAPEGEFKLVA